MLGFPPRPSLSLTTFSSAWDGNFAHTLQSQGRAPGKSSSSRTQQAGTSKQKRSHLFCSFSTSLPVLMPRKAVRAHCLPAFPPRAHSLLLSALSVSHEAHKRRPVVYTAQRLRVREPASDQSSREHTSLVPASPRSCCEPLAGPCSAWHLWPTEPEECTESRARLAPCKEASASAQVGCCVCLSSCRFLSLICMGRWASSCARPRGTASSRGGGVSPWLTRPKASGGLLKDKKQSGLQKGKIQERVSANPCGLPLPPACSHS